MEEKKKLNKWLSKALRIIAIVEMIIIFILAVIALSTGNIYLFKVLLYIAVITAFFSISLLILNFLKIIDSNPIITTAAAFLLLSLTCGLILAISGFPTVADSLNKSIETLEKLPGFMETQTNQMNKSIEILQEVHDFLIEPKPEPKPE